jgi:hypothetical protein
MKIMDADSVFSDADEVVQDTKADRRDAPSRIDSRADYATQQHCNSPQYYTTIPYLFQKRMLSPTRARKIASIMKGEGQY